MAHSGAVPYNAFEQRYCDTVSSLPELDLEGRRSASDYMAHSTGIYHGEVTHFLYVPKVYDSRVVSFFEETVHTTYAILSKVTERYVTNPAYRKLFGFPHELEELILVDPGYPCPIPIMRMDIFLDEDDLSFKFCEFNTDGTSAMNEDREITNALVSTPAFREADRWLSETHDLSLEPFELFDSWVKSFEEVYSTYERKVDDPHFAIVDFMEETTPHEIEHFKRRFEACGHTVSLCEIRDLVYEGGRLRTPEGTPIDVVYRRAVTADIMSHIDEIGGFLDAVKAQAVCLIGSFRTQVAHAKTTFEVLHRPETAEFLSPEERAFVSAHVPYTAQLTPQIVDERLVLSTKDSWIIKPQDGYAASGVYAGVDTSEDDWRVLIGTHSRGGYIVQEYCEQYESRNLDPGFIMQQGKDVFPSGEEATFDHFKNLTGLYTYAGDFKGVLARAGKQGTICAAAGGYTLGVFKTSR